MPQPLAVNDARENPQWAQSAMTAPSPLRIAAHRRAAVRRSTLRAFALYPSHWRTTSNIRAKTNPIAVPWGRPGDTRRRFAP